MSAKRTKKRADALVAPRPWGEWSSSQSAAFSTASETILSRICTDWVQPKAENEGPRETRKTLPENEFSMHLKDERHPAPACLFSVPFRVFRGPSFFEFRLSRLPTIPWRPSRFSFAPFAVNLTVLLAGS
jgi:hypothetical protein